MRAHPLPEVRKPKLTRQMPKEIRYRSSEFADAGRYRHKHRFAEKRREIQWHLVREWKGNHWFLYEKAYCIYDGCSMLKLRQLVTPYCEHCGQVKRDED